MVVSCMGVRKKMDICINRKTGREIASFFIKNNECKKKKVFIFKLNAKHDII